MHLHVVVHWVAVKLRPKWRVADSGWLTTGQRTLIKNIQRQCFMHIFYFYHIGIVAILERQIFFNLAVRENGTAVSSAWFIQKSQSGASNLKLLWLVACLCNRESLRQESKPQTFCIYHAVYFTKWNISFYMSLTIFTTCFFVSKVLNLAHVLTNRAPLWLISFWDPEGLVIVDERAGEDVENTVYCRVDQHLKWVLLKIWWHILTPYFSVICESL